MYGLLDIYGPDNKYDRNIVLSRLIFKMIDLNQVVNKENSIQNTAECRLSDTQIFDMFG